MNYLHWIVWRKYTSAKYFTFKKFVFNSHFLPNPNLLQHIRKREFSDTKFEIGKSLLMLWLNASIFIRVKEGLMKTEAFCWNIGKVFQVGIRELCSAMQSGKLKLPITAFVYVLSCSWNVWEHSVLFYRYLITTRLTVGWQDVYGLEIILHFPCFK